MSLSAHVHAKDRPCARRGEFYDNASRNAFEAAVRDLGARVKRIEVAVSGLKPSIRAARTIQTELLRTAARIQSIETKVSENVIANKHFVGAIIDVAERVSLIERDISNRSELKKGFASLLNVCE